MPKYDVVVVGAGNAGLSAALQCQLAGRKTLLIEKHNVPGGAATSFVRGRFEIEPSLHELCDFGPEDNPGDVRNILDGYGVKLDWLTRDLPPVEYQEIAGQRIKNDAARLQYVHDLVNRINERLKQ